MAQTKTGLAAQEMETKAEIAVIAAADQSGDKLDQKVAVDYYKLVFGQAEQADRFLFDITKANLLAFAAIVGLSSTGLFSVALDRTLLIPVCLAALLPSA